jgi:hypothetical protein
MERSAANEHTVLPGDYCGHNADFGEVHYRKKVSDEYDQTQAKVNCVLQV